ncbi:hypothetical protein K458DRAFT_478449 [Lentithecium fluviatile CBS 122367]|uniref:Uncharacterized protein n=1 Tax=Lentithecium fluviatile CBS 122367 TaxID=1168545 RepID=A0A6G1IY14_9PLEO|nr:hypothetical protein K458DRAFT_478449 [Lentithecium fluviatile CBS 122367]
MKYTLFSAAALAALAFGAPTKRTHKKGPTDAEILNYALTLEHLEDTFYRQGLTNFTLADFTAAGYDNETYTRIQTVSGDETTHVKFLTDALKAANATPVAECTYAFGITDVKSFLATASVLEGVGVSAYLGTAAAIMEKTYLTAAASILTVESRHSAYIRNKIGQEPFPQPFDNPLSINSVYTLAAQFIVSCPESNPPLPVKAFPTLTATPKDAATPVTTGSSIVLMVDGYKVEGTVYAAFITVTGPVWGELNVIDGDFEVVVPEGVKGQSYVVLTSCKEGAGDDYIVAGPAILEVM